MKKVISIILVTILSFIGTNFVFAENNNDTLSVEVIPMENNINGSSENNIINDEQVEETIDIKNNDEQVEYHFENQNDISLLNNDVATWESKGAISESRANVKTLIVDNNVYIIGGFGDNGYSSTIEKFNDSTSTSEIVGEVPDGLKGFAVVAVNKDIYFIGGYVNESYINEINIFNTQSCTWSKATSMKEKRDSSAALYTDNKIFVFGGRNEKGIVDSYEFFDLNTSTWNKVTSGYDQSVSRIGADAKYINGYVCLYGGLNSKGEKMGVDLYSVEDMKEKTEIIPTGNAYISMAWGKDKALIFAGKTDSSQYDTYELTVDDSNVKNTDVTFDKYPINCEYTQNIIYNGYLYCLGGYNLLSKTYSKEIYKYSTNYGDFAVGDGKINNVVTKDGNKITLNFENDKEYILMFNVKNFSSFDGYTFTIDYPENSFEIIDPSALTSNKENIMSGNIEGTDITVTERNDSGMSFVCSENIPNGKTVSETVNAVIIKANTSGKNTITYRMIKE